MVASSSEVEIRLAAPEDAPSIHGLIKNLAEFEKMADQVELTIERLAQDIQTKAVLGILAKDGDTLAGMVLFYFAYSTWKGRFVHMEDLYVDPKYRRKGIGRKLWAKLGQFSVDNNVKRLQWNVLDWNENAIKFYETMPCTNLSKKEGWLLYRMNEEDIVHLATLT